MIRILYASYIFLAVASLILLRTRRFTKLYPLAFVSSVMFVLSALMFNPFFDLISATLIYLVIWDALKHGFLTYPEFKPPLFEKRITTAGIILLAIGMTLGLILHRSTNICVFGQCLVLFLSRLILANTFAILALSRERSFTRVGDYEVLMLASALILADGVVDVLLHSTMDIILNLNIDICMIEAIDVHLLYTSSLLFMLSTIRK